MTWIEAGGHYNWLMFRDGNEEFYKKLKAQAFATALAVSSYPTYLFMSHDSINFFLGVLISIVFFGLLAGCCWLFFKFKSNSDSFVYMIGLLDEKGIVRVDYDHRHYIYDWQECIVEYEAIENYRLEEVKWKEWSFYNLKVNLKNDKIIEIGIPKDFFVKKSEAIIELLDSKIRINGNFLQNEARS